MCIIGVSVFVDFLLKFVLFSYFSDVCLVLFVVGTVSTSGVIYCGVLICCNVRILWCCDKVFDFFVGNQYC